MVVITKSYLKEKLFVYSIVDLLGDDPFSKCARLLEKLNFPTIRTRTCVYQVVRNFSFSGNSAYVLHG